MASVDNDDDGALVSELIPIIDLRDLTQSELYALSLCSAAAFDPHESDDIVIPKIDRSVFNESAGSRKQTYSRLRLAPAASAASICRRTPHLRSPKPSSVETDPERAENSRIVGLLKGLFEKSRSDGEMMDDFASIRVVEERERDRDREGERDRVGENGGLVADLSNRGDEIRGNDVMMSNGMKRKRGRPRKDENGVVWGPKKVEIKDIFIYENVENVEEMIVETDVVGDDNVKKRKRGRPRKDGNVFAVNPVERKVKEDVVYGDIERDKDLVNSKGVIVNVAGLGGLEDPYGPEIRRRTEGMGRVEELLGFLDRLGGQWGSRRKKRKMVDASNFGDWLPRGWMISISLKRKEGRVWLFCRRYISPSGRQFMSCKEVSSYLLSITGQQDRNQPSFPQQNETNQFECEMASGNAPNLPVLENNRKDDIVYNSSITVAPLSNNEGLKIGEQVNGQLGALFKCQKCMMTFQEKDDLLQHNIYSHRRRRSRTGISITDGVIIRDGLYECQFCHKTFNERKRYNGHVGNHVKYDFKNAEKSIFEQVQDNADHSSLEGAPNGISLVEAKIGQHENFVAEPSDARNVNGLDSGFCRNELVAGSRVETSSNKLDYDHGHLTNGKQDVEANIDGISIGEAFDNREGDRLSSSDEVDDTDDSMDTVPFVSKISVESKFTMNNIENDSVYKTAGGKTVFEGVSGRTNNHHIEQDVNSQISSLHPEEHKLLGLENKVIADSASVKDPNREVIGGCGSLAPNGSVKLCDTENKVVDEINHESNKFAAIESVSGCYTEPQTDTVASLEEEKHHDNRSVLLPLSERDCITVNYGHEISSSSAEESRQHEGSFCHLFSPAGGEHNCGVEDYVRSSPARKVDAECKVVETCRNSELVASFGGGEFVANLTSTKEKSLEFCSLLPSETEKIFDIQDDVTAARSSSAEEHRQEYSGSGLNTQSCFAQTSRNHDLSLAFNNPQAGSYANTDSFEVEKYPVNWSSIPSRTEQNIGVQANISRVNNNMTEEGVGSLSGLFSLSCNGDLWGSDNNFNTAYTDRGWEAPAVGEVGNSANKKYMVDFGHNNVQPVENFMPGGIWRTGEEQALQSNLANSLNPMAQSHSSFRNFNIVAQKAEDGLFRVNENFDREPCFEEGPRSGRTEPVEFSFLTRQNLTSIQGDSKNFSYDTGMDQELDSSYWLGKHDLMPNVAPSNQVTTLCVWCRNEFQHEPVHSDMQAGIGSLCPTCSARISEQVNVL